MDLTSHEVNPFHLKITNFNAAHTGFVLQHGSVISHKPLRTRLCRVNELNLLFRGQAAAGLGYRLRKRIVLPVEFPLFVVLQDGTDELAFHVDRAWPDTFGNACLLVVTNQFDVISFNLRSALAIFAISLFKARSRSFSRSTVPSAADTWR